jgi:hypothetical protein
MYELGGDLGIKTLQEYACSKFCACLENILPHHITTIIQRIYEDRTKFPFMDGLIRACLDEEILDCKVVNEPEQLPTEFLMDIWRKASSLSTKLQHQRRETERQQGFVSDLETLIQKYLPCRGKIKVSKGDNDDDTDDDVDKWVVCGSKMSTRVDEKGRKMIECINCEFCYYFK